MANDLIVNNDARVRGPFFAQATVEQIAIPFPYVRETDIFVLVTESDGDEYILSHGDGGLVAPISPAQSGTFTALPGVPAGSTYTIYGKTLEEPVTLLSVGGNRQDRVKDINLEIARQALIAQEFRQDLSRATIFPFGQTPWKVKDSTALQSFVLGIDENGNYAPVIGINTLLAALSQGGVNEDLERLLNEADNIIAAAAQLGALGAVRVYNNVSHIQTIDAQPTANTTVGYWDTDADTGKVSFRQFRWDPDFTGDHTFGKPAIKLSVDLGPSGESLRNGAFVASDIPEWFLGWRAGQSNAEQDEVYTVLGLTLKEVNTLLPEYPGRTIVQQTDGQGVPIDAYDVTFSGELDPLVRVLRSNDTLGPPFEDAFPYDDGYNAHMLGLMGRKSREEGVRTGHGETATGGELLDSFLPVALGGYDPNATNHAQEMWDGITALADEADPGGLNGAKVQFLYFSIGESAAASVFNRLYNVNGATADYDGFKQLVRDVVAYYRSHPRVRNDALVMWDQQIPYDNVGNWLNRVLNDVAREDPAFAVVPWYNAYTAEASPQHAYEKFGIGWHTAYPILRAWELGLPLPAADDYIFDKIRTTQGWAGHREYMVRGERGAVTAPDRNGDNDLIQDGPIAGETYVVKPGDLFGNRLVCPSGSTIHIRKDLLLTDGNFLTARWEGGVMVRLLITGGTVRVEFDPHLSSSKRGMKVRPGATNNATSVDFTGEGFVDLMWADGNVWWLKNVGSAAPFTDAT